MKRICYTETLMTLREDYFNHIKYSNFTPAQVAYFELDEYKRAIKTSPVERVIIYISLAVVGIEYGELIPEVRDEIIAIVNSNVLGQYKSDFELKEFNLLSKDLDRVILEVFKYSGKV